jgi:competence protein ComEC
MRFCLVVLLITLFGFRVKDRFFPGTLRVTFFDVGQGDAVLLRFPKGKVWLVDAGGGSARWNWGMRDLYLELSRMGVLSVDVGILTHPDADHLMGFFGLLPQVHFQKVLFNHVFDPARHPRLNELTALSKVVGTDLIALVNEAFLEVDGVSIRAIPLPKAASKNESPLALWLQYGACRILLAGDAEKVAELRLLSVDSKPVDLLKVNHHGSRTSSSEFFLDKLRPQMAVTSVGASNRYGHPAPSVLGRLERFGSQHFRTDREGYVEITVSNGMLTCQSARGDCGTIRCRSPREGGSL